MTARSPQSKTFPPPMVDKNPDLADVVHRNIFALIQVRREFERRKSAQDRVADAITRFAGSMLSVILHALLFGSWIIINTGIVPGFRPFDPFPFVMLAMWASVEAIFLSTFVLISQNRTALLDEKRSELDLQINLLAEHEITRLIELTDAIARHLGVQIADPEVEQLKKDVAPEAVLEQIEQVSDALAQEGEELRVAS